MDYQVIYRTTYLDRIRPFVGKQLIKVLTGQRGVGKSYILKQLILQSIQNQPESTSIYVNKEDMQYASIKTADDLHQYVLEHTKSGFQNNVYIDEIQTIKEFE